MLADSAVIQRHVQAGACLYAQSTHQSKISFAAGIQTCANSCVTLNLDSPLPYALDATNQVQASAVLVFPHIVMPHCIQVIVQLIDNRDANGHMQAWYFII